MSGKPASTAQLINQASRSLAALGDARLKPLGFRYAQVPVLAMLRVAKTLTQAELVRALGVEQSSMAQLLMRMESEGTIERRAHPDHARSSLISVTPEAAKHLPAARKSLADLDDAALAGFSAREVATLTALLERVVQNLKDVAED